MKVSKEIQFTITEEEICTLLLARLIENSELPELGDMPVIKRNLYYNKEKDLYTFEIRLEKGAINDD